MVFAYNTANKKVATHLSTRTFSGFKNIKIPNPDRSKSNFHEKTKLVPLDSPSFVDAAIVSRNSFRFSSLEVQPMRHI